jgi:hypothetical protein
MKVVNLKLFALKYRLVKILNESLEADKKAIKEGTEIWNKNYCDIRSVPIEKSALDREKVQELCDKYGIDIKTLEKTTTFSRLDVKNIPAEVDNKIDEILEIVKTISDDSNVKRVANGLANKSK